MRGTPGFPLVRRIAPALPTVLSRHAPRSLHLVAICAVSLAACMPSAGEAPTVTSGDEAPRTAPAQPAGTEPDVPSSTDDLEPWIDQARRMPLVEQSGQVVMTAMQSTTTLSATDAELMRSNGFGGVILFGFNYRDPAQLRVLVRQLQSAARQGNVLQAGLLVSIDQEGGFARHLPGIGPELSSGEMGASLSAREVTAAMRASARQLRGMGLNMNLAPVADLAIGPERVMAGRSFGSDPVAVGNFVAAAVAGMQPLVLATAKHFPGLGGATANTDHGVAVVDRTQDELAADLQPFERAIEADVAAVMLAHARYPALGLGTTPASLSPGAVELLRDRYGFDGLIITDSLNAVGLREVFDGTVPQACARAIQVGVDIALVTGSLETARLCRIRIRDAVEDGTIPERRLLEAVARVLRAKAAVGAGPD